MSDDDRAERHSHAAKAMPESDRASIIAEQDEKAKARDRFEGIIRDTRTQQTYRTTGSDPFVTLDKLRFALQQPHAVLSGTEPEVDEWR